MPRSYDSVTPRYRVDYDSNVILADRRALGFTAFLQSAMNGILTAVVPGIMRKPQIDTLKADIAVLANLEAQALSKKLFAAFGAYRRYRNTLEAQLSAAVQS